MQTGLENFIAQPEKYISPKARIGLVTNPTAVDSYCRSAIELMNARSDLDLVTLFGPEHGIYGEAQDMIDVGDNRDPISGAKVISLYGKDEASLTPTELHLKEIDVLIFDIQDIGSRYYTYSATMALCMRAIENLDIKMLVLDRPNPIGGIQIEGGGLDPGYESFVGLFPIPQRHGLTIGELARLYQQRFSVDCDLEVVPCTGWTREQYFDQLHLPWVMPSPNMPALETAIVYPGMCLLEGTNISEGRGTTRPFEIFGAPFVNNRTLAAELKNHDLPGVVFRSCVFQPTFHKFAHKNCSGLQLHVIERSTFLPFCTGLAIVSTLARLWPENFEWRQECYEFKSNHLAFDLLTGKPEVRTLIEQGANFDRIKDTALTGVEKYYAGREQALLY